MNKEQIKQIFEGAIVEGITRELVFLEEPEEGYIEVRLVAPLTLWLPSIHISFPINEAHERARQLRREHPLHLLPPIPCVVCGREVCNKEVPYCSSTCQKVQEIRAVVAQMPAQVSEDLAGRIKAFQKGLISGEDVVLNAKNTIQWLQENDLGGEIPFYQQFLEHVEQLPSSEWQDPFGAWSDLPDTMLDELDQMRHESVPSPMIDWMEKAEEERICVEKCTYCSFACPNWERGNK